MKVITKKQFKEMHGSGELKLFGGYPKTKEEILERINEVKNEIEKYTRPVSNYGNIETSKKDGHAVNIYLSDCEDFLFVETITKESVFTVAYLSC